MRGFVEGTTGITYVYKKDKRRHRRHCVHYRKDGSCAYMSKCCGSAQCMFYEEEIYEEKDVFVNKAIEKVESKNKETVIENKKIESAEMFSGVKAIRVAEIIVPDKFLRWKPDPKKVESMRQYYREHKKLDKPIFVSVKNGKYYLEDKYLRYYVAKELGITWIKARIGSFDESVLTDKLFKIGGRVRHKKYGIGTLVENDGKYIVVVFEIGKKVRFDLEICIKNGILICE